MLEAFSSLFRLRWSTQPPSYHPLPENVTRTFISTPSRPNDKLELLVSNPSASSDQTPVLFLHGGFGHASVWLPFMTYLSSSSPRPLYALSHRNHGASYSVSYLRMVFGVGVSDLCAEIAAAVSHIQQETGRSPILVAHSSAGGLAQSLLANKLATVPGLVLLDAVPHFGNLAVYANWAKHDPWFMLRMLLHGYHVISPLSSLNLVRRAFFGPGKEDGKEALTDGEVEEFERWMPRYESLTWPMQMYGSWMGWLSGRPSWLDVKKVVAGIVGGKKGGERVCVMVGDKDVLMDVGMCRKAAEELRNGFEALKETKKSDDTITDSRGNESDKVEGALVERRGDVRFVVVSGAGHHAQNDVQWQVAAEALRKFVEQV